MCVERERVLLTLTRDMQSTHVVIRERERKKRSLGACSLVQTTRLAVHYCPEMPFILSALLPSYEGREPRKLIVHSIIRVVGYTIAFRVKSTAEETGLG